MNEDEKFGLIKKKLQIKKLEKKVKEMMEKKD